MSRFLQQANIFCPQLLPHLLLVPIVMMMVTTCCDPPHAGNILILFENIYSIIIIQPASWSLLCSDAVAIEKDKIVHLLCNTTQWSQWGSIFRCNCDNELSHHLSLMGTRSTCTAAHSERNFRANESKNHKALTSFASCTCNCAGKIQYVQ